MFEDHLALLSGESPPPVEDLVDEVFDEAVDGVDQWSGDGMGAGDLKDVAWSTFDPSGLVADLLAALPVAELDDFDTIEAIKACERLTAHIAGLQADLVAHFARLRGDRDQGYRHSSEELGAALRVSGRAAANRLAFADQLAERLPATRQALRQGRITLVKAHAVADATVTLEADAVGRVEDHVLVRAPHQTPAQLRACLRRAVLKVDPGGAKKRHERRKTERRVEFYDQDDGMAVVWAWLTADAARAIYELLTDLAKAAKTPDDERSMDQRRADALVDLCLRGGAGGASGGSGIAARVQVTVGAGTLLGLDNRPGELAGYGPIPAQMARELAACGTWRRLLTDPATGALLDYGRTAYRPPAALAEFVRARDVTCRFPGCRQPAWRSDLDHVIPYPHGPTAAENLGPLCRRHHDLKQQPGWNVRRDPDGSYTWTSPTGHTYVTPPPDTHTDPPSQHGDPAP
ncbi:MAG: DUF222 domain-containing protein [Streptosporangiales bacterium]|nr:DUF222 domain-containing protein [Streptosporangiales bacterium]